MTKIIPASSSCTSRPSELDLDLHSATIRDRAAELGARLVVIDSISAFEMTVESGTRLHDYVWTIADHFRRMGVTVVMTKERHPGTAGRDEFEPFVSYVADTVIVLRIVESGRNTRRLVNVLKSRGTAHSTTIRQLCVHPSLIYVDETDEVEVPE